jgi:hypothetical protein
MYHVKAWRGLFARLASKLPVAIDDELARESAKPNEDIRPADEKQAQQDAAPEEKTVGTVSTSATQTVSNDAPPAVAEITRLTPVVPDKGDGTTAFPMPALPPVAETAPANDAPPKSET